MSEFQWPCEKRYAHGPHDTGLSDVDGIKDICPGVKAHPATMIGGNHPEEQWVRPDGIHRTVGPGAVS